MTYHKPLKTSEINFFFRFYLKFSLLFASPAVLFAQNQNISDEVKVDSTQIAYRHKNSFLIAPLLSSTPETSWAFAVASAYIFKTDRKDSTLRTSTLPMGITYTVNNQILIACAGNIIMPKERYTIRWESTFSNFPDKFWGIGNNVTDDNGKFERYSFTQLYLSPQIHIKVSKKIGHLIGFGWDFQNVFKVEYGHKYKLNENILPADSTSLFEKYNVAGRDPYLISGLSLYYSYDNRPHAYCPDRGALFRIRFTPYSKLTGSDYNFQVVEIDFRKFFKISGKHVLAFQGYTWNAFGDVPYRSNYPMGNYGIMRGYYSGRYRDRKFFGAQVEYRFPLFWRLSGVAFAGMGQVAHELNDYKLSEFKHSIGTGIRFALVRREKLNLRFDMAWGNNNTFNTYIILAESF